MGVPVFLLFSDHFTVLLVLVIVTIGTDICPCSSAVPHLPNLTLRLLSLFSPCLNHVFAFLYSFYPTNILFTFSHFDIFPHSFDLNEFRLP